MSYDFLLFRTKQPATSPADITEENAGDMGSGDELRARLSALFPEIEWEPITIIRGTAVNWQFATLRRDGTWWRFHIPSLGSSNKHLGLETSFGTVDKYGFVERLCDATGWTALDRQAGPRKLIVPRR